jgi:hypothetical protein
MSQQQASFVARFSPKGHEFFRAPVVYEPSFGSLLADGLLHLEKFAMGKACNLRPGRPGGGYFVVRTGAARTGAPGSNEIRDRDCSAGAGFSYAGVWNWHLRTVGSSCPTGADTVTQETDAPGQGNRAGASPWVSQQQERLLP